MSARQRNAARIRICACGIRKRRPVAAVRPPPRAMPSRSESDPLVAVAALYRAYAAILLAATVLLGTWMRAMMLWPGLVPPVPFQHLIHAHSHVGFFGWLVLGIAGALVTRSGAPERAGALRRLGHAVAAASALALVAFAWQGYGPVSIALSALHVVLWILLARELWPLERAEPQARPWMRLALVGLLAAGAATLLPGILTARGIESGWLRELGIELFLDLFIFGWVVAASLGLLYAAADARRWSGLARLLFALGVVPSAILYVAASPPAAALLWVGRVGSALVGLGMLAAFADLIRTRRSPLAMVAVTTVGLVGALEIVAGLGIGRMLLHGRPIVLAFVHLVLLGIATSTLLSIAPLRRRVVAAIAGSVFAAGAGVMVLSLAAMGWPWLSVLAAAAGADVLHLLLCSFVGGAAAALAAIVLAVPAPPVRSPSDVAPSLAAAEAPVS